jgi:cGMP-dependent protein kinase
MFEMLNQIDLLDNNESRFYIASIILCLEYLHSQNIIYRDLKPENIMIQSNGYLRMIDLGTAKILSKNEKTFSVIGTPHYMAPEIVQGRGYTFYVDLWALGICMFEFQCGYVPFGEDEDDPFEIYKVVLTKEHEYPDYFLDDENELA